MKKITFWAAAVLISGVALAAACSSPSSPANTPTTTNADQTKAATNMNRTNNAPAAKTDEDVPPAVKTVFPDAQSFTTQHKDVPKDVIASIEKDTSAKVPATDHHSFLAFSTTGGARKQVGAATVVKAGGRDVVIVYDSKDGSPVIREIRAEGIPAEFLKQFAGKGHDDDLLLGADIKPAGGINDAQAKAITEAVRVDVLTMQALYGTVHTH